MKAVVLILDLTNDCNLRCSYCYASGGEHADCLSVSDAVLAIEKFYNRFKCQIQVLFHGGEPLLCFDSIQKIISITETKDFSNYISYPFIMNSFSMKLISVNTGYFITKYRFNYFYYFFRRIIV